MDDNDDDETKNAARNAWETRRRVLFPDLDDDDVALALLAEQWDFVRELPPLEPLEWPDDEASAAVAVLRLGLWAARRAGTLRAPILEALHTLQGQIRRVADRRTRAASSQARTT